jgi:hypothetical protein
MARRRKSLDPESCRLLNLWSPDADFGAPIGCVSTTFTFDAGHFEEQCLARFVSMETDPSESARAYLIEREEKLSQVFACILVDQRHAQNQRSLRWHLLPIRLPGLAIQHAKLSLLLWERHLRIVIGSANLTAAGYRTNREMVATLDFTPEQGGPLALVRGCIDYLEALSRFSPGRDNTVGPRAALATFLTDVRRRIGRWSDASPRAGEPSCELVPLLPAVSGRVRSVTSQLREFWRGPAAQVLRIVSPFFDQTDSAVDRTYKELTGLLTTRGPRSIEFCSSGCELSDGKVEIDIPKRLADSPQRHPSTEHDLKFVEPNSPADGDAQRALHAKALLLGHPSFSIFMLGSSNCTTAGLGLSATPNAELNLAYVVPTASTAFWNQCVKALPPAKDAPDLAQVSFIATAEDSNDEPATGALLPAGFVEALFRPNPEGGGELQLELEPSHIPANFEIFLTNGTVVLTDSTWSTTHSRPSQVTIALDRAVSNLTVKWQNASDTWVAAAWAVNVTDTALLAPPDELRNLTLEDLLAVLTSARPIHWAVDERITARDERSGTPPPDVDPHKKVDTSKFLMRRMRRLARALEGLRARMELPVSSIEGLRWRLQGPLGPIALGRALQAEAGAGSPFFIAEVATTLQDIRWQLGGAVKQDALTTELAAVQRELKALALGPASDTPENLRDYVAEELTRIPS